MKSNGIASDNLLLQAAALPQDEFVTGPRQTLRVNSRRTLCASHRSRREESRPYPPPLRGSLRARRAGRLRNSACGLRQSSPKSPGPAVLLGGGPRGAKQQHHPIPILAFPLKGKELTLYAHHPLSPLHRLGFPGESGVVGCVCLRPKAEFNAAARFARKIEGSPKGRCGRVAFFWLTFLGEARKVTCPPGSPGI